MELSDIVLFEQAVSIERFSRYLSWAGGNPSRALQLYTLNMQLSESLYTPLQTLEIALRNKIDYHLALAIDENWYDEKQCQLASSQAKQVEQAKQDLIKNKKDITSCRVVASLTFGDWTAFFNNDYEELWRKHLHKIAYRDQKPLRRKDFSTLLTPIRSLRNRIAHHEPILELNLPKHYNNIIELTCWLSPISATWCQKNSKFLELYPSEGLKLERSNVHS